MKHNTNQQIWLNILYEAQLNPRTFNVLRANVNSLSDFLKLTDEQILKFHNSGPKTLQYALIFKQLLLKQLISPKKLTLLPLTDVLKTIPTSPRNIDIFLLRYGLRLRNEKPLPLHTIANQYNLSKERIRQIILHVKKHILIRANLIDENIDELFK